MLSPERFGRVTGSEVGAILGFSPHDTRQEVMYRKVAEYQGIELPRNVFLNDVIFQYGKSMEPLALEALSIHLNREIKKTKFYKFSNWLGATPDGELFNTFGSLAVSEVKCPYSKRDDQNPVFDSIFSYKMRHYYAQVQIEIVCSGAIQCYFYQYSPYGEKLEIVYHDFDWCNDNIPKLEEFWNEYIKLREIPMEKPTDILTIESTELEMEIKNYLRINKEISDLKIIAKEKMEWIVKEVGKKDAKIGRYKIKKIKRKGDIDFNGLLLSYNLRPDFDQFRGKDSEYFKISEIKK